MRRLTATLVLLAGHAALAADGDGPRIDAVTGDAPTSAEALGIALGQFARAAGTPDKTERSKYTWITGALTITATDSHSAEGAGDTAWVRHTMTTLVELRDGAKVVSLDVGVRTSSSPGHPLERTLTQKATTLGWTDLLAALGRAGLQIQTFSSDGGASATIRKVEGKAARTPATAAAWLEAHAKAPTTPGTQVSDGEGPTLAEAFVRALAQLVERRKDASKTGRDDTVGPFTVTSYQRISMDSIAKDGTTSGDSAVGEEGMRATASFGGASVFVSFVGESKERSGVVELTSKLDVGLRGTSWDGVRRALALAGVESEIFDSLDAAHVRLTTTVAASTRPPEKRGK